MYEIPIYRVALVKESSVSSPTGGSVSPGILVKILAKIFEGLDREHFKIIMLNTKNKIIGINTVSVGSLSQAIVAPPEVFKPALLCNAAAVILTHNHPSGDAGPSFEDRAITKRLEEAGSCLGIKVLDHIIMGEGEHYFSFQEDKKMQELQKEEQRKGGYIRKAIENRGKGKATLRDLVEITKYVIGRFCSRREGCEKEILGDLASELKLFLGKKRILISLRDEAERLLSMAEGLSKGGNNDKTA